MRARPRNTGLDCVALLIAPRHRLLWAHARSRNGRIVLFVVGYLSLALVAGLMAVAGLAAGASARTGQATFVASVALRTVFVNSTLGALMLGSGVDETFSDAAPRRHPMTGGHALPSDTCLACSICHTARNLRGNDLAVMYRNWAEVLLRDD